MGLNYIAFKGRDRGLDRLRLIEQLSERRIKILKIGDDALCFEDPNGFAVEIFL